MCRISSSVHSPSHTGVIATATAIKITLGLLLVSTSVGRGSAAAATSRPWEVSVATEGELLAAMGSAFVRLIHLTSNVAFSPGSVIPGAAPTGVYELTRNVTLTAPAGGMSYADWYPVLDFSQVFTPRLVIPLGVSLRLMHLMIGHIGPQGSLSGGAVGYGIPFIGDASAGSLLRTDCFMVTPACAPMSMSVAILSAIPRPRLAPGAQLSAVLPSGICIPSAPDNVLGGKCYSTAVALVDIAWIKTHLNEHLYSADAGQYMDQFSNCTVLCEEVISLACVKAIGVMNCTKLVLQNISFGPPYLPPPPAFAPRSSSAAGMSADSIAIVIGTVVGGVLLVALVAVAIIAWLRKQSKARRASEHVNHMYDQPKSSDGACVIMMDGNSKNHHDGAMVYVSTELSARGGGGAGGGGPNALLHEASSLPSSCTPRAGTDQTSSHSDLATAQLDLSHMDIRGELKELVQRLESSFQDNQLAIKDVIGCGAHGTVYSGIWKSLPVAVKSLLFTSDAPLVDGGSTKKDRILMEAALSGSISHPNVVSTYSCDLKPIVVDRDSSLGSSGVLVSAGIHVLNHWRVYIIQELCDGGSLQQAIEYRVLNNALSPDSEAAVDTLLELAAGLACGMSHLHEHNIIHGDLNPANVLLKHSRHRMIPKVCDFGFSVLLSDGKSHVSNANRGTPFYIAPEVAQRGELSKAADVYAMGVMLWELYMGEIVWMVSPSGRIEGRPGFPGLPTQTPHKYQRLVAACLDRDPTKRPTFPAILECLLELRDEELMAGVYGRLRRDSSPDPAELEDFVSRQLA